MIFRNRSPLDEGYFDGELISELTVELDKLAGFKINPDAMMRHYVKVESDITNLNIIKDYSIKVANIDVGTITIDADNNIISIEIKTGVHELIKYSENIDMLKYIGERFEVILDEIELVQRRSFDDQFVCNLTKDLDNIAKLNKDYTLENLYVHYLFIDNYTRKHYTSAIPIRVPGCTVGGIWIDKDNKIVKISINNNCIIKYPEDINEIMKKYIGVKIKL